MGQVRVRRVFSPPRIGSRNVAENDIGTSIDATGGAPPLPIGEEAILCSAIVLRDRRLS